MSTTDSSINMIKGGYRRPKKSRRGNPKTLKGQVMAIKKDLSLVKKEINKEVEVKNFDGNLLTATLVGWDFSNVYNLFAPTQGVGQNARVGDQVWMDAIDLKYHMYNTGVANFTQCRVVVFIDEDNVLTPSNVFQTTSFINTINAPYAHYNRSYRSQFTILYDELHDLDSVADAQTSVRVKLPIKKTCTFVAASTAILQNAIKILFVGNQAIAAPATLNVHYAARLWYKDS